MFTQHNPIGRWMTIALSASSVSVRHRELWYWRWAVVVVLLILSVGCAKNKTPTAPPLPEVKGTLTEYEGVPILRLWGTPGEQGYAHGYLLAHEIVTMIDSLLKTKALGVNAHTWESEVIPAVSRFEIEQRFAEELQGMLAGIETKLGGDADIPALGRSLRYEDLAAINVGPDLSAIMMCSSFSAWGPMTADGNTITGRNFDWGAIPGVFEKQYVIVYVAPAGSQKLGFVAINWAGFIGCCSTAMNAEGVTLNINATNGYPPSVSSGFYPRLLIYREAIESAHVETALTDVETVLRARTTTTPQNIMITIPNHRSEANSVVFEYDGYLSLDGGVSVRNTTSGTWYQVLTNHSRVRRPPTACERYTHLTQQMDAIVASEGAMHLDRSMAWSLLNDVAVLNPTHHRIVMEPNLRVIHVGLSVPAGAPLSSGVTLDVAALLANTFTKE